MNDETIFDNDSFKHKSREIMSVLLKIQNELSSSLNSFNEGDEISSLLNNLNNMLMNDDLIYLIKEQNSELISLEEKYNLAMNEIAQLEDEKEYLNEKMQNILSNEQEEEEEDKERVNELEIATVSLAEYNKLKEEYLNIYSLNQSYEQKHEEYNIIAKSYEQAKESLYMITYSFEELKKEHDIQKKELKERMQSLTNENEELKDQFKVVNKHCSLYEIQKNDANTRMNWLCQNNNLSISKIKTMEKANSLLKRHYSDMKTTLMRTKKENEEKIEELKNHIEELEEKNIYLIQEKRRASKDGLRDFLLHIENKKLSFHYIPTDNEIAIYLSEERIGEVRNKSMASMKRNHSNKMIVKYKYILGDYPDIDELLSQKKEMKQHNRPNDYTLKSLNSFSSSDEFPNRKTSNTNDKGNHLNLLSWDDDNTFTFTNKLCKIRKESSNYFNEVSHFNNDSIPLKTKEEDSMIDSDDEEAKSKDMTINNSDSLPLIYNKKTKDDYSESTYPKQIINTSHTSVDYSTARYANKTHIQNRKGHAGRKVTHHDDDYIKEIKCINCLIF